jgi:hypothetical protein
MKHTRREFASLVGAAVAWPTLWERAVGEFEQTGDVSSDLALALLDAQGERGIFADPKHLDELRAAIGRKIRDHKIIRSFKVPEDVQPLLYFKR